LYIPARSLVYNGRERGSNAEGKGKRVQAVGRGRKLREKGETREDVAIKGRS
jgi:hypothetical protein